MADIINFYDELLAGDREATLSEIQSRLKELKLQLSSKVLRPSSQKDEWLRQLDLIEQALVVFKDEDSRDRYDIELRRAPATEVAAKDVDWTTRAWNYYFIGDNGAALVASRKAKEQSPKSAMPFVVSAWVQLKDEEWKQAKQEADEAFVLDDQVEDSVDVQMARGTAYFFMGKFEHKSDPSDDYSRALTSFEKALVKASPGEQAEIHWRRGFTFDAMRKYQDMYDEGVQGLSIKAEIADNMRHNLEKITSDAINLLCNDRDSKTAIKSYETKKSQISQSNMAASSQARITANIDANLARLRTNVAGEDERDDLLARQKKADQVKPPTGVQPGVPLIAIAAAVISFFIMLGAFSASPGVGAVFLLITGAIVAYVVVGMNKRGEYEQAAAKYSLAQDELEEIRNKLGKVRASVTEPIWLKD